MYAKKLALGETMPKAQPRTQACATTVASNCSGTRYGTRHRISAMRGSLVKGGDSSSHVNRPTLDIDDTYTTDYMDQINYDG